jgi:hypothetical protein
MTTESLAAEPARNLPVRRDRGTWLAWGTIAVIGAIHAAIAWFMLDGRGGMTGGWPILLGDHGIHYHQAFVTRHCLSTTGTTAGYDPSFMAGYPMSIVSDLSSTLPDVALFVAGPVEPGTAYKILVLACTAATPWLFVAAAVVWGASTTAVVAGLVLFELYFWSDFAIGYAVMGMVGYLLSVPLGLLAIAAITSYLERGGFGRWLGAASASAAVFLVHLTSAMLVGPAAALAYGVAVLRSRRVGEKFPVSRHLGFWAIGPVVLALNAFWWVPGLLLASTMGKSEYAFAHPESVWGRLGEIFWLQVPIESVLISFGLVGLALLARRNAVAAAGLGAMLVAGFFWGYVAGAWRSLDSLQPGRHTYVFYAAASAAGGIALGEILGRLRSDRGPRLDRMLAVILVVIGVRMQGPILAYKYGVLLGGNRPALASRPPPRLVWLIDRIKAHVKPGERLLFEETGNEPPEVVNPFEGLHFSPILPDKTGVEVIGGPFLHTTLTTNFTQFGEGKLFGHEDWGRAEFVRYAGLYRPTAIVCWSPKARLFCLGTPDLIEVLDDDGTLLIGRVRGFEGATIRGKADVAAGPNRIEVKNAVEGDDGLVVLRYHAVPLLVSDPPVAIEPVYLEDDPVPFIAFRPNGGTVVFRMKPAPWSK